MNSQIPTVTLMIILFKYQFPSVPDDEEHNSIIFIFEFYLAETRGGSEERRHWCKYLDFLKTMIDDVVYKVLGCYNY